MDGLVTRTVPIYPFWVTGLSHPPPPPSVVDGPDFGRRVKRAVDKKSGGVSGI